MGQYTNRILTHLYYRSNGKLAIPNYTPVDWFECDFLSVSEAGYGSEYEIKESLSDYKADFKKEHHGANKHQIMGDHPDRCPMKHYWFVLPENLLPVEDIPEYAGVLWWIPTDSVRVYLRVVRNAPRLGNKPLDKRVLSHIKSVFGYRYWSMREKLAQYDSQMASLGGSPLEAAIEKRSRRIVSQESNVRMARGGLDFLFKNRHKDNRPSTRAKIRQDIQKLRRKRKYLAGMIKNQERDVALLEQEKIVE